MGSPLPDVLPLVVDDDDAPESTPDMGPLSVDGGSGRPLESGSLSAAVVGRLEVAPSGDPVVDPEPDP